MQFPSKDDPVALGHILADWISSHPTLSEHCFVLIPKIGQTTIRFKCSNNPFFQPRPSGLSGVPCAVIDGPVVKITGGEKIVAQAADPEFFRQLYRLIAAKHNTSKHCGNCSAINPDVQ